MMADRPKRTKSPYAVFHEEQEETLPITSTSFRGETNYRRDIPRIWNEMSDKQRIPYYEKAKALQNEAERKFAEKIIYHNNS